MNTQQNFSFVQVYESDLFADIKPHVVTSFWKFHNKNPHIYALFERFSKELLQSNRERYGAKAIMERIRWHVNVETNGSEFKICNTHTSCYPRLLALNDPRFKTFFRFKKSI